MLVRALHLAAMYLVSQKTSATVQVLVGVPCQVAGYSLLLAQVVGMVEEALAGELGVTGEVVAGVIGLLWEALAGVMGLLWEALAGAMGLLWEGPAGVLEQALARLVRLCLSNKPVNGTSTCMCAVVCTQV